MTREFEQATCPVCQRRVSAWVPHFGDGTDVKLVPHRHDRKRKGLCQGSGNMVGELKDLGVRNV